MNILEACEVIYSNSHKKTFLVATMGAMKAFDILEEKSVNTAVSGYRLSSVPLMGGASGLGLGLALGLPHKKVIIVDGDASLLMELGAMATIGNSSPSNLIHIVINNGTQFTGLANLKVPTPEVDYEAVAVACGYQYSVTIRTLEEWKICFSKIVELNGPIFVNLIVNPAPKRVQLGYEPEEIPDNQFNRMHLEFYAMKKRITKDLHDE